MCKANIYSYMRIAQKNDVETQISHSFGKGPSYEIAPVQQNE